jgi:RNA polymerase sigma-B factor
MAAPGGPRLGVPKRPSRPAGGTVIDPEEADALFHRRDDDPAAREALIVGYQPFAVALARRFLGRGESAEDLVQVADVGLINAVDRYDPARGVQFTTYASATIVGELKRHLRDHAWSVRVPRGLQERALAVGDARARLRAELGRSPTVADIAAATDLSSEDAIEALQAGQAYVSVSIEAPLSGDPDAEALGDLIPDEDETEALADRLAVVAPAVRALPDRERRILFLRFYRDLTQTEIAQELGISQMHVSRLLSRALDSIRSAVQQDKE